eukprot:CAMPEP_0176504216 /NCGR_PEP_ID=MMETSP0200_2-20121128/15803_1 /TAXON_ID=947934 /ORGANISM="Chaetoceros sp., Strain GSL56" /LENGTH=480 /DNA_ID=CAMNT_0017903609 /DNA_START=33 /DNA_END=1476 /DNA_ORIENTATION=+
MGRIHLRKNNRKWIKLRHVAAFSIITVTCLHLYLATILTKRDLPDITTRNNAGGLEGNLKSIGDTSAFVAGGGDDGGSDSSQDIPVNYPNAIESLSNAASQTLMTNSFETVDTTNKDSRRDDIDNPKTTIGYAISLTSCGAESIDDGAAVLKHSIALASFPLNENSKYRYIHPDAMECSKSFEILGYNVLIKETPIDVSQIKGDFLRERVVKSGCCQEKEFLKLYSYTLTEHPVVVHLDLDSLILAPLDDLFDAMLNNGASENLPIMHNQTIPDKIEAFYTKDYNMVSPGHKHPGVQGGFIVVRPNMDYFDEYLRVILEGNFIRGAGWAGKWGGYYGAQQIQGLCSYFFEGLHPGTAVELNRCIYNNMNDNPKKEKRGRNPEGLKVCIDGQPTCEDCRTRPIEDESQYISHFATSHGSVQCMFYTMDFVRAFIPNGLKYGKIGKKVVGKQWPSQQMKTSTFTMTYFGVIVLEMADATINL